MLHIIPSFWYFSLPWEDFITLSLCDELYILLYTRLKCLRMWFTRFPVIDTIKIEPAYNYDYRNVQGFIVFSRRFIYNAYHNISFCRVWSFQTLRYSCTLIYEIIRQKIGYILIINSLFPILQKHSNKVLYIHVHIHSWITISFLRQHLTKTWFIYDDLFL